MRALLLLSALAGAAFGCTAETCETDADCEPPKTCMLALGQCANPSRPRGADCGDRCGVNTERCADGAIQRCGTGPDGCSQWMILERCSSGQACREGACRDVVGLGQPCTTGGCADGLGCLGGYGLDAVCRPACQNTGQCAAGERCVAGVCVPEGICDDCERFERACRDRTVTTCRSIGPDCNRFRPLRECRGQDACEGGACAGTLPVGSACGPQGDCVAGAWCLDPDGRCAALCQADSECPSGLACRAIVASGGRAVCTSAAGLSVSDTCAIRIGRVTIRDPRWDLALPGRAREPDVYVEVRAPGGLIGRTRQIDDTVEVDFDETFRAPAADALQAFVTVLDRDPLGTETIETFLVSVRAVVEGGGQWSTTFPGPRATIESEVVCGAP